MPDRYSLTVINHSELSTPTFAVFAALPISSSYASLDLAWLTQQINQDNHYVFSWEITWGFTWSASGTRPGYQWQGSGTLPADPNASSQCQADFSYNGDFQLTPSLGTPSGDTLRIIDNSSVPVPSKQPSSVGVTLDGGTVCVTEAGPNLTQTFTLHPTYYINAGQYVEGQMVDAANVASFQELKYSGGNTSLVATLNQDNTWSVGAASNVNFAALLSGSRG